MNFEAYLNFTPNQEQQTLLEDIIRFVQPEDDREIMVLKGAAGTGKTSIMKAITEIAKQKNYKCRLAAPTGRAAKVLYSKTNSSSVGTIHSMIYLTEQLDDGRVKYTIKSKNEDGHCIYIIDESSMISDHVITDTQFISDSPLLTDLIEYVSMGDERNKIIFVGDHFQLPPFTPKHVKAISYALDAEYIGSKFDKKVSENTLTKVMRQEEGSDVLALATDVRNQIANGNSMYAMYPDSNRNWWDALNMYVNMFSNEDLNKVLVVCHTNNDVNFWNQKIRQKLFPETEKILEAGDVVQLQNTNWVSDGVIFNGDTGIIIDAELIPKSFGGLHFSECTIEFGSGIQKREVKKLFCWEVIMSKYGNLTQEQSNNLFAAVMQSNPVYRKTRNITDDKYLNALWLKYGYASTCHKAQGGEWETVFVNPYLKYLKNDKARWLYTAYTRASINLFSWII